MVSFCFLLLPGLNFFDIFRTQKLFFGINNEMGNFCMGDEGGYGIADQPPKGHHFRPRARLYYDHKKPCRTKYLDKMNCFQSPDIIFNWI